MTRADYLEEMVRDNALPSNTREKESASPGNTRKKATLYRVIHGIRSILVKTLPK